MLRPCSLVIFFEIDYRGRLKLNLEDYIKADFAVWLEQQSVDDGM